MKRHSQAPSSLHEFDLAWAPLFREKCLKWAIEAQKREPALVGHGLNPVTPLHSRRLAAYKAGHPTFPHESTMEQLFSEEQFECYRALGEHIGRRMISGEDDVSVSGPRKQELLQIARTLFPDMRG